MNSLTQQYDNLVQSGTLNADPAQAEAVERLDKLSNSLSASGNTGFFNIFKKRETIRGLYLWGGVGRGKSMLMDLFFENANVKKKARVHFHEFMGNAHDRIAQWRAKSDKEKRKHPAFNRKTPDDPIPPVADELARGATLLCFDELQVTDIADAMLLQRLFKGLFDRGVVAVATSNRHPDDLYKDGLNRQLFLPAIALLKKQLDVFELQSARDYRLARLQGSPVYHSPLGSASDAAMDDAWARMTCGITPKPYDIHVKGRTITVPQAAGDAARFEFAALCDRPLGAADYLAITARFGTLFIDHIPAMTPNRRDQAKRFVTLIDAIYESRVKLICSAAVEPDDLYPKGDGSFEFERTASRLMEMQSLDYLGTEHRNIDPAGG
ncbi:MAG: cell division protein ZapE [Pseudomonadota bacterium]